ncbi:MAG: glycosyltransferase family 2 protein [Solirubrobacteraceae bacterium]
MSSDGSTWSLRAQTVLYGHEPEQIWRLLQGLDATARKAIDAGLLGRVEWALGDNSGIPIFGPADLSALNDASTDALSSITYESFGENLGSSGGHNRLATGCSRDLLLILNPDTYPSPIALMELVRRLAEPRVGLVEARQIPLEHPREYDLFTGETSWASTCCVLVRRQLFDKLGGFDSQHFFLHCDDVDFSWRARKLGYQIVIEPHAAVFHDKRPTPDAAWPAPDYELYHSALGRLMLATRWGRPDIVDETIASIEAGQSEIQLEALAEFRSRLANGQVPAIESGSADIAQFINGEYAVHRF